MKPNLRRYKAARYYVISKLAIAYQLRLSKLGITSTIVPWMGGWLVVPIKK